MLFAPRLRRPQGVTEEAAEAGETRARSRSLAWETGAPGLPD
jgi:hypothetical protein